MRLTTLFLALATVGAASTAAETVGTSAQLVVAPADLLASCRAAISASRTQMAQLKSAPTRGEAALEAFDVAEKTLEAAGSVAYLAKEVHPDGPTREAGETCVQETSAVSTEFSLDRGIYDALARVDPAGLDGPARYYLQRNLQEFRLEGVDRDEATRAKVRQLNDELVKISQEFNRNIRSSVLTLEVDPADLEGLPADFVRAHPPGPNGKVKLTTDSPDYGRSCRTRKA